MHSPRRSKSSPFSSSQVVGNHMAPKLDKKKRLTKRSSSSSSPSNSSSSSVVDARFSDLQTMLKLSKQMEPGPNRDELWQRIEQVALTMCTSSNRDERSCIEQSQVESLFENVQSKDDSVVTRLPAEAAAARPPRLERSSSARHFSSSSSSSRRGNLSSSIHGDTKRIQRREGERKETLRLPQESSKLQEQHQQQSTSQHSRSSHTSGVRSLGLSDLSEPETDDDKHREQRERRKKLHHSTSSVDVLGPEEVEELYQSIIGKEQSGTHSSGNSTSRRRSSKKSSTSTTDTSASSTRRQQDEDQDSHRSSSNSTAWMDSGDVEELYQLSLEDDENEARRRKKKRSSRRSRRGGGGCASSEDSDSQLSSTSNRSSGSRSRASGRARERAEHVSGQKGRSGGCSADEEDLTSNDGTSFNNAQQAAELKQEEEDKSVSSGCGTRQQQQQRKHHDGEETVTDRNAGGHETDSTSDMHDSWSKIVDRVEDLFLTEMLDTYRGASTPATAEDRSDDSVNLPLVKQHNDDSTAKTSHQVEYRRHRSVLSSIAGTPQSSGSDGGDHATDPEDTLMTVAQMEELWKKHSANKSTLASESDPARQLHDGKEHQAEQTQCHITDGEVEALMLGEIFQDHATSQKQRGGGVREGGEGSTHDDETTGPLVRLDQVQSYIAKVREVKDRSRSTLASLFDKTEQPEEAAAAGEQSSQPGEEVEGRELHDSHTQAWDQIVRRMESQLLDDLLQEHVVAEERQQDETKSTRKLIPLHDVQSCLMTVRQVEELWRLHQPKPTTNDTDPLEGSGTLLTKAELVSLMKDRKHWWTKNRWDSSGGDEGQGRDSVPTLRKKEHRTDEDDSGLMEEENAAQGHSSSCRQAHYPVRDVSQRSRSERSPTDAWEADDMIWNQTAHERPPRQQQLPPKPRRAPPPAGNRSWPWVGLDRNTSGKIDHMLALIETTSQMLQNIQRTKQRARTRRTKTTNESKFREDINDSFAEEEQFTPWDQQDDNGEEEEEERVHNEEDDEDTQGSAGGSSWSERNESYQSSAAHSSPRSRAKTMREWSREHQRSKSSSCLVAKSSATKAATNINDDAAGNTSDANNSLPPKFPSSPRRNSCRVIMMKKHGTKSSSCHNLLQSSGAGSLPPSNPVRRGSNPQTTNQGIASPSPAPQKATTMRGSIKSCFPSPTAADKDSSSSGHSASTSSTRDKIKNSPSKAKRVSFVESKK